MAHPTATIAQPDPPPPRPAQDSPIMGALSGIEKSITDIDAATAAHEKSQSQLQQNYLQTLKDKPQAPNIPSINSNIDTFQALGNPMTILAIFGSLLTRRPMVAALNAASGAMQGMATGWQDHLDAALKQNNLEIERYRIAMESHRDDVNAALAAVQNEASQFSDHIVMDQAKAGLYGNIAQIIDARQRMAETAQARIDALNYHQGVLQETVRHNQAVEDASAAYKDEYLKIQHQKADAMSAAAGQIKATGEQQAAYGYSQRMSADMAAMGKLEAQGVDMRGLTSFIAVDDTTLTGMLAKTQLSPDQQVFLAYARDWIRAKLRKESGAAIGEHEAQTEWSTYFAMPGDDDKAVAAKRDLRDVATRSMKVMAGPLANTKLPASDQATKFIMQNSDFSSMTPDQLFAIDPSNLQGSQLDDYEDALKALEQQ